MLLPDTVDENYDEEEEEYDDEKEEYFDYNEKSEPVKLNETKETLQQKAMTELEAMLMQQENECLHKWQEKFNGKSATAQYSTMCLKYMERYQLAKLDYLSKNMLLNNYLALIQQNTVRDICAMITSRAMVDINWFKAAQAGDNEWMKQLYEYYHTAAEDEITRVWIYND